MIVSFVLGPLPSRTDKVVVAVLAMVEQKPSNNIAVKMDKIVFKITLLQLSRQILLD